DVASKVILTYKDVHQPPEMFSAEKCKQQYYDLKQKGEVDMQRLIDENIDITKILNISGNVNKVAVSTSCSAKHSTSPIPLKSALMSVVCENRIPEEMKKRTCQKGSEARETQRWVLTDHSKQTPKLPVNAISDENIKSQYSTSSKKLMSEVEEESCVRQGDVDYSVTNWMGQLSLVEASDDHETCSESNERVIVTADDVYSISVVAESCVSKEGSDYLVLDNMRKLSFVDTSDDYRTQLVVKDSCIGTESNSLTTDFVPGSEYLQTQPVLIVNKHECEDTLIELLKSTPKMNDLKFKEDIETVWQKSPVLMEKPIAKSELRSRISSEDDIHTVLEDTCRRDKSQEEIYFQRQHHLKETVQNTFLNNHPNCLEKLLTTSEIKESRVSNEDPDLTITASMKKYEYRENIDPPCKTFSIEGEMRNAEILKQNKIWKENNNDKKKDNLNYKKKHIEEQTKIVLKNQGVSEQKLKSMNKSLMFLYNQLTEFKNAQIFKKPVTEEEAPDYKSIIFRPMDFPTIKKNIQSGAISNITELENDVLLMIDNALLYNPCTHIVHKMAKEMRGAVLEFFQ
ncbi:Nucleosome-remodeling factor subunit NURF301, partial [Gryllus bimaculatus]